MIEEICQVDEALNCQKNASFILSLALWAIIAGALADDAASDEGRAVLARRVFHTVNVELLFEVAGFSGLIDKVP